ncbi:protein mono-ADP-ribosyltransferase PARP12-like, partial [Micropterus salmoides]|uniref:protein mono-ADP-ribosyltransferase PARP12-like n=1 Tax=Micropterus salmoides TaxID=27706 RepID=UPI0018EE26E1
TKPDPSLLSDSRRPLGQQTFTAIPDSWDKTQVPQTGFKRVSLLRSSDEFKEIEALFCKTMRGFDILSIERIQNKALWEVFQWQKNQMKNNNGGRNVTEKKLFHGTDSKHVDVICHTNFDWRICGTHGTAFGKGSYFARDAKYSHSYTGDSDVKSMFISRLLVGDYTRGSSDYRRPPSKDGGDINFFDSCVDDVINPSIFVVFEKHQIYPEYLLQYKTTDLFDDIFGAASALASRRVPAPRPAPQPSVSVSKPSVSVSKPTTSVYKPTTSVYKPTTSVYKPTTSVYKPTTLVSKPTTSGYKPTTSVYQPSTPSYPPSASPYHYQSSRLDDLLMMSSQPSPPSPPVRKAKKGDSCVIA